MKRESWAARIIAGALVATLLVVCTKTATASDQKDSPIHIIWDDDGSPDGIIALLYFLHHPGVKVEAITVSCGEAHPDVFAEKLTRMLAFLGTTGIPVAAGRSKPLEGENAFPEPWRKATDTFWGIELPEPIEKPQSMSASQLIVEIVNKSQKPVIVFVSGNHTNLAEALRLDPAISKKIKTVEVMGGALYTRGNIKSDWSKINNKVAEWNIWVDPLAAKEVFTSGLTINLTPLDATNKVMWTKYNASTWKKSGVPEGVLAAKLLQWMLDSWHPSGIYVWDLIAAVNVTTPKLCKSKQVHLKVVTEPGDNQGQTVVNKSLPPNTNVCITPNGNKMKKHVKKIFNLRSE